MSEREAEELRETYTQALIGSFSFIDEGIKFTSGGHKDPEIWSTIDDGDIQIIVDSRLRAAQFSVKEANKVRRTIAWYQKAAVYVITVPRMWQTVQWYQENGFDLPFKLRRPQRRRMKVVQAESSA